LLEEALAVAEETATRGFWESARCFLAELDVLEGRPEHAIARLEPIVEESVNRAWLLLLLAWAYLSLGDNGHHQRAAEAAEQGV
jgi:hypothetical protein